MWESLLAAVDSDDDGQVTWSEIADFMRDVLAHIERERMIAEVEAQHAAALVGAGSAEEA